MGTIPKAGFGDPLLKARSERRFALWRSTVLHPAVVLGLAILGIGAALWVHPLLGAGIVVVALIGLWAWADSKATGEWWLLLLGYLKMQPDDESVGQLTPLLRSGDQRVVRRAATDGRRRLLIFRSTDVSRDSDGDRQESHHDYTCVVYHDAAPSIRFISAHEHKVSWAKWLGDDLRGRTIGGVEEFQVESVELHERFELRSSTADGERARMIFSPSFIVWFTRQGVSFEYEGGDLVVIVDRVLEHAEEFKLLLSRADEIHAAVSRGVRG